MTRIIRYLHGMINSLRTPSPVPSITVPMKINTSDMIAYAKKKGCSVAELSDAEKDLFIEGGLENFRKYMKAHNYYTGF